MEKENHDLRLVSKSSITFSAGDSATHADRNPRLDFVKGILVFLMLMYHTGALFIVNHEIQLFFNDICLSFVSGSWIFLCGAMVTYHYGPSFHENRVAVSKRLCGRSLKTLAIFVLSNVLINGFKVIPRDHVLYDFDTIIRIALYGDGSITSFEILLGIFYILLIGPLFLQLRLLGPVLALAAIAWGMQTSSMNVPMPSNWWQILCGLGGMITGYGLTFNLSGQLLYLRFRKALAFVAALMGITAYYLLITQYGYTKSHIHVYLLGVVCILSAIYISHELFSFNMIVDQKVRLLGRYSLFCYIGQMGILWSLWFLFSALSLTYSYMVMLTIAMIALFSLVLLLDYLVRKYASVTRLYNYAFR